MIVTIVVRNVPLRYYVQDDLKVKLSGAGPFQLAVCQLRISSAKFWS